MKISNSFLWAALAGLLVLSSCSQSGSENQEEASSSDSEASTVQNAGSLEQLKSAVALRLERKLSRGIALVPGTLTLGRAVSVDRPFGGFRATVKYVDETYVELPHSQAIEALQVSDDQVDAVTFGLRGITVLQGTGIAGSEQQVSGSFSANWLLQSWDVEDFSFENDIDPEGHLLTHYRGQHPIVLGSPELAALVDRLQQQVASAPPVQTPGQREMDRIKAMEKMRQDRVSLKKAQGSE